jgi:hypothetical protein
MKFSGDTGWVSLLGWILGLSLAQGAAPEKPNIIVILSDDMGFSDLGCFGGEIQTPHSTGWPPTACASPNSTTPRAVAPPGPAF